MPERFLAAPLGLALTLLAGCASSPLPRVGDARSAARVDAEAVARAPVVVALTEAPPLPGEPVGAWRGLRHEDDDAHVLSVDDAVRRALENNRALRAAMSMLGASRGRAAQEGVLPNPVVELEVLPERDTGLEISVEYDLSELVLAPLRARAARPDVEAREIALRAAAIALTFEVRAAYFSLSASTARLSVAQRALEAFAASNEAASALFEAGNATALERAIEVVAYERARMVVAAQELEVSDALERLRRLLGVHGADASFSVSSAPPEVPASLELPRDLEGRAIDASLELAAARAHLEGLGRRAGLVRTEGRLPDVSVDVHVLRGQPSVEAGRREATLGVGGGVSISVPLFDRRQGARRAIDAELDAALERYEGLAIDIRSAARERYNALVSTHARARHIADVVRPAQLHVLDETLRQYNAMQVDVFRVIEARRAVLEVELASFEAARAYHEAKAAFDALMAGQRTTNGSRAAVDADMTETRSRGEH